VSGAGDRLTEPLLVALRDGCPALLLTHGADGYPASAFTWVVAVGPQALRFAADHGTSTLANLERERRASLQFIAAGGVVCLVKGAAAELKPRIEASPFAMAVWQLAVEAVKDQSWPGVTVRPLGYDWAEDRRAKMLEMETAVYSELRKS